MTECYEEVEVEELLDETHMLEQEEVKFNLLMENHKQQLSDFYESINNMYNYE